MRDISRTHRVNLDGLLDRIARWTPRDQKQYFGVVSDVTLRLQQMENHGSRERTDTKPGDIPTITVIACTEHQHTIPHDKFAQADSEKLDKRVPTPKNMSVSDVEAEQAGRSAAWHKGARNFAP